MTFIYFFLPLQASFSGGSLQTASNFLLNHPQDKPVTHFPLLLFSLYFLTGVISTYCLHTTLLLEEDSANHLYQTVLEEYCEYFCISKTCRRSHSRCWLRITRDYSTNSQRQPDTTSYTEILTLPFAREVCESCNQTMAGRGGNPERE